MAAGGGEVRAKDLDIGSQTTNGATVKCPRGEFATGGGAVQFGGPNGLRMSQSGPLESRKGWRVDVRNSNFDPRSMRALAVCSPRRASMQLARFNVDPGFVEQGTAGCGRGQRAIGGGVVPAEGSATDLFIKGSGPLDSTGDPALTDDGDKPAQWFGAVANVTNQTRLIVVWVICSRQSKASISASEFSVEPNQASERHVKCGSGRQALSGGVIPVGDPSRMTVQASGPLAASGALEDTRNGGRPREWYGSGVNLNGFETGPRTFRVLAICE